MGPRAEVPYDLLHLPSRCTAHLRTCRSQGLVGFRTPNRLPGNPPGFADVAAVRAAGMVGRAGDRPRR